jgi:outer membrane usher protein
VEFETITGAPLIVRARRADGSVVPLGAIVGDELGAIIGMVGQAGLIYARSPKPAGQLSVRWTETAEGSCTVSYDLGRQASISSATPFIVEAICQDTQNYRVDVQ